MVGRRCWRPEFAMRIYPRALLSRSVITLLYGVYVPHSVLSKGGGSGGRHIFSLNNTSHRSENIGEISQKRFRGIE